MISKQNRRSISRAGRTFESIREIELDGASVFKSCSTNWPSFAAHQVRVHFFDEGFKANRYPDLVGDGRMDPFLDVDPLGIASAAFKYICSYF